MYFWAGTGQSQGKLEARARELKRSHLKLGGKKKEGVKTLYNSIVNIGLYSFFYFLYIL